MGSQSLDVQTTRAIAGGELALAAEHCPGVLARLRAFERQRSRAVASWRREAREGWLRQARAEIAGEILGAYLEGRKDDDGG